MSTMRSAFSCIERFMLLLICTKVGRVDCELLRVDECNVCEYETLVGVLGYLLWWNECIQALLFYPITSIGIVSLAPRVLWIGDLEAEPIEMPSLHMPL